MEARKEYMSLVEKFQDTIPLFLSLFITSKSNQVYYFMSKYKEVHPFGLSLILLVLDGQ